MGLGKKKVAQNNGDICWMLLVYFEKGLDLSMSPATAPFLG